MISSLCCVSVKYLPILVVFGTSEYFSCHCKRGIFSKHVIKMLFTVWLGSVVVDCQIGRLSLSHCTVSYGLRQVGPLLQVAPVPLLPSSIIWYWLKGADVLMLGW